MAQHAGKAFRDPTALVRWTRWFLCLELALSIVGLVSGVLEHRLLAALDAGAFATQEEAVVASDENDARQVAVSVAQVVVYLVSGVFVLLWIHRAAFNVRQLGATDLKFTPGWAVGWYFIPIANLWQPYRAMQEIWRASVDPHDWPHVPSSSLLVWWWGLWLTETVLGNLAFRLSMTAAQIDELLSANVATLLLDAISAVLSVVFLVIVSRVQELQMSHHERSA